MFVNAENIRLSGRVVPPLAAGRSPTNAKQRKVLKKKSPTNEF